MVELFLKQNRFFKCDDEERTIENQLKGIFTKLGIENIKPEEISNIIEDDNNYEQYKLKNEEIIKNIPDKDAVDLITNLLVINPKKRFTSLEVLNSKYLLDYKDTDPLDVKVQENLIYEKLNDSLIDVNKFIEIIGDLRSRL